MIAAALVTAALVTAALVAAGLVAAGLVAGLVPAARRLVLPAPVPAPPVTALRLARRALVPRTRLAVLASARRRAGGLLGCGLLSGGLLSCGS